MKFEAGRIYKFENSWCSWVMKALGPTVDPVFLDHWDVYLYAGRGGFEAGDTAPIAKDKIKYCEDWTPQLNQVWSDGDNDYLMMEVDFVNETVTLLLEDDYSSYDFVELFSEFKLVDSDKVEQNGYSQGHLDGHSGLKWL